jgi:hypothetical protein
MVDVILAALRRASCPLLSSQTPPAEPVLFLPDSHCIDVVELQQPLHERFALGKCFIINLDGR